MLPAFLLALREGLEAALIVGIVLGALRKMNRDDLQPVVWAGTLTAVAVSAIAAIVLYQIGISLEGKAEEIFEGITMLLAAVVLFELALETAFGGVRGWLVILSGGLTGASAAAYLVAWLRHMNGYGESENPNL